MHDQSNDFSFKSDNGENTVAPPKFEDKDLYSILNIGITSNQDEIQGVYKRLSRLYRPDKYSMDINNY